MNRERGQARRPAAVARSVCVTAPSASATVLQSSDQGKLRLDDPVSKYIPAFATVKVYAGGSAAQPTVRDPDRLITIADLLTHTAGLTYGFFGNTPVDSIYRRANLGNPRWTNAELSDSLARLPLLFSPGSAWNYSFAIDVLGRVVEVVSGMPLDRYLESAIFRPLGMRNTGFRATPGMDGHIVTAYHRSPGGTLQADSPLVTVDYTPEGRMLSGGGGLLSTVGDYLRFAQMLLNGGGVGGRRGLQPPTAGPVLRNHLPAALTPIASPSPDWPPGKNGFGDRGAVRLA